MRYDFPIVAVRIPEVEPSALVVVVDLAVVLRARTAAESHALFLDPFEDRVELLVRGDKGVVVAFKPLAVEGKVVIYMLKRTML